MRSMLPLLLAIGCGPATATIGETNLGDPIDTEEPGRPGDSDDTGTTEDDPIDEPDPLDLSQWSGTRTFDVTFSSGGGCEDEVSESGANRSEDPDYEDAFEACPECDAIYEIEVSPQTICQSDGFQGIPVGSPIIRGLELSENGGAVVWSLAYDNWRGWRAEQLSEGSLQGDDLTYEYDGRGWGLEYTVEGLVEF